MKVSLKVSLRGTAAALLLALLALHAPGGSSAPIDAAHLNPWPEGAPSPDFDLSDLHGKPHTMRSFRGHVTLVTFGYANCPGLCSLELQKLAAAMRDLGPRRQQVRVVFVTLDPARDSPALLGHFVHSFDPAFVALRGTAAQTDAATKHFSIESARVPGQENYLIDHTIEEFVFDRDGHLRLVGASDSSADDVAHDVAALLDQHS